MLNRLINFKYRDLLILAVILRILIMPFYFHPDIKTFNFQASFLKKGVFNIYDYLLDNRENLPLKEEFVYFPLAYFFVGGYQAVINPLLGSDFDRWVSDASGQAAIQPGIFRYLFLLKLPYLFFDIAVGILLMRFFVKEKNKKTILTVWLFNPITIVLIYIFSNIDIITVFLTLLTIFAFKKEKYIVSGILLGLASGFKTYPLLFLPVILISMKDTKKILITLLVCILTLVVIVLPFWSEGFFKLSFASGLTTRIFSSGFPLGFGETIMPAVLVMVIFFLFVKSVKRKPLWLYFLAILLLLFSFIHFHIQWLLWLMPFMALLLVKNRKYLFLNVLLILSSFFLPFFYEDRFLSVSLLKSYSLWYDLLPTPFSFVQKFYDPYVFQSVMHTIFAGTSIVLIVNLFKKAK